MKALAVVFLFLASCSPKNIYTEDDLTCMTRAIYHEARGETYKGQVAVGWVILNRLKSDLFPKKICDVVYQPKQFTDLDGRMVFANGDEFYSSKKAAKQVLNSEVLDPVDGMKCFYAQRKVRRKFHGKRPSIIIGNHTFWDCR